MNFKACHLVDPESLTLADGGSLAMEMASHLSSEEDGDAPPPPTLDGPIEPSYEVTGCAGGLMEAAMRGLDGREVWIEVAPEELRTFLRKNSVLQNMMSKA
jgi:hypothetical protein